MQIPKNSIEFLQKLYAKHRVSPPDLHVVLGTGFSDALDEYKSDWECVFEFPFRDMPGMPGANVPGHAGKNLYLKHRKNGRSLMLQAGRIHGYEGHPPDLVTLPVVASFLAGCGTFLLTNAAGSLKRLWKPGSAMLIRDHFNGTGQNPLVGANLYGDRFPDMSAVYDVALGKKLKQAVQKQKIKCLEGTYGGLLGPSFETPTEVKIFAKLGLGAVGMSTVWEAISLKHAGARVIGLSYLSNYGSGLEAGKKLDHYKILELMKGGSHALMRAMLSFAADLK